MQKVVLKNGLTVLYKQKKGKTVVVEVMAKVGSNDEIPAERGIAHFLEHILFEGTEKRPNSQIISNEIERIGGDFNAYTTNERTCFFVKVLQKHFTTAIDILSDIMQNSVFKQEHIDREKNVVLKEIDMVHDEPRYFQWILLQQTLFTKHPSRNPTYGDRDVIKNLTRQQVIDFFSKYYVPSNMVVVITGDVPNWKKQVTAYFTAPKGKDVVHKVVSEPIRKKGITKKVKKNIANTYCVIAFKTVPRTHKDSYVLEVINGILGRGQSGKMFAEIRSKRGLAYDTGTQHISEVTYGYFAVYASVDKKNVAVVRKVALGELEKLRNLSEEDLKDAKDFIEGSYLMELDDTQKIADQILFWEHLGDANAINSFVKRIKQVTVKDVQRVVKQYFKNPVMVVLEGK